jgi:Undecaprenyl-phosphate glucose phosphotransferase
MDIRETALLPTPLGSAAPGEGVVRARTVKQLRQQVAPARTSSYAQSISRHFLLAASALLLLADGLAFLLAFDLSMLARHPGAAGIPELTPTVLLSAVIVWGGMWASGAYSNFLVERLTTQFARAFLTCSAVFALLLLIASVTASSEFGSGPSLSAWYLATLVGLAVTRLLAYASVSTWRRSGKLARVVAVVDVDGMGAALAQRMQRHDASELHYIGTFSQDGCGGNAISDLVRITRAQRVDEIIIAAGGACDSDVESVVEQLGAVPTNLHVCNTMQQTRFPHPEPSLIFGHSVLTLYRRPLDGWGAVLKRAEDLMLGGLIIFLLLPLMGVIAALIKLDSRGPVLFRQKRLGLNNTAFEILKFRSMVHRPAPEQDVPQARQNDPRVTRVGRFLRRSSLDELPQLFNVLWGEMSLVGPRPHAVPHNLHYSSVIERYNCRHRVRPGITGWAQVNGFRGETDTLEKMQRRVEFDLDYIDRWSPVFDAKVLLKTVIVCFRDRAAY